MKKTKRLLPLLLAIALLLGILPQAVSALPPVRMIITDKFTDAKFLAYIRIILGKGFIDPIYADEMLTITSLDVADKGFSSLAGIEYADNLEELRGNGNQLTTLDITSNSKLKILHCWNNKLTSLDVSKNPALRELYCDQNKLKALDVSKNPELEILNCFTNELTQLDVSKNLKLKELNCYGNTLAKIDVSKNVKLTVLRLQNTNLSSVDVSKNTELQRLNVSHNKLAKLTVSKNVELVALDCSFNQLVSLDVSKNSKLKELYCQGNFLPGESAIIGLNKSKLTHFNFNPQASIPSEPDKLSAQPGDGKVVLNWAMPVYGGENAIKGFEVSSNDGGTWVAIGVETSFTFTNLTNGQAYVFQVRAINSAGKGLVATAKAKPVKSEPTMTNDVILNFSTEGGSIIDSISKPKGTLIDLLVYQPTRDGFSFEGWYGEAGLENKITSIQLDKDTTVYAKWLTLDSSTSKGEGPGDPPTDETIGDTDETDKESSRDNKIPWFYVGIGLAVLLLGGGAFFLVRRKKSSRTL